MINNAAPKSSDAAGSESVDKDSVLAESDPSLIIMAYVPAERTITTTNRANCLINFTKNPLKEFNCRP